MTVAPSTAQPIVALATASGRGAIGVIRVSGPSLGRFARDLLGRQPTPRHAHYGPFRDQHGEIIDHGLALYFPAPHSYTGEDVLELQGHGGPVVMQLLLSHVLQAGRSIGLRMARPGEFTERAFLNDKMDLAQAEAVADLIDAGSAQAARMAARSLGGEFSGQVHQLVAQVIETRMLIEACLDFPEEELDGLASFGFADRLDRIAVALDSLLARARQGVLVREGMNVVIAGEPNVGKSSLLNALARDDIAIVTDVPGTTRDRLSQAIVIDGVPLNIIDTAGIRDTDDPVEVMGIERARREIEKADVVLWLTDATVGPGDGGPTDPVVTRIIGWATAAGASLLPVLNKIDLLDRPDIPGGDDRLRLSARTGAGIAELEQRLLELAGWQGAGEAQFIARERHLEALRDAGAHLATAGEVLEQGPELMAEELRLAQQALDSITGTFSADDLLGEIFSRFCIGK